MLIGEREAIVSEQDADRFLFIAAVWVNPAARDAGLVYANNSAAARQALRAGTAGLPPVADIIAARRRPANRCCSVRPPADGAVR